MANTVTNIVVLDDYQRVAGNSAGWDLIPGTDSGLVKFSFAHGRFEYDPIDPLILL